MINEISVMFISQFLISKITISCDNFFDPLSINSIIEAEKFEPGTKFEKYFNEIKDNHLRSIASSAMNISDITSFPKNFKHLSMNIRN